MSDRPDKDQQTEDATPRKRQEAREGGQVPLSTEFIAAIMLCIGFAVLIFGGHRVAKAVSELAVESIGSLSVIGLDSWSLPAAVALVRDPVIEVMGSVVTTFVPVAVIGVLVAYGQIGVKITPKAIAVDLNKLNPVKGVSRIFSARTAMRTGMALVKMTAITVCMIVVTYAHFDEVTRLGNSELGPLLQGLMTVGIRCTSTALVAILIISIIDLVYQRYQHERDLKMSKQEVKDEHRSTEGDPHVRSRIRRAQQEMAAQRMMQDVPEASVVVTNPTHFAVALRYQRDGESDAPIAPTVVAKGVDHLAFRIRDVATEAGVHIYEDPPLARALYAQVEVGEQIPEEFYAAVAAILSTVYRLQGETAKA